MGARASRAGERQRAARPSPPLPVRASVRRALLIGAGLLAAAAAAGCGSGISSGSTGLPGADAGRAPALIAGYGCGSCHTISGVRGADGLVGPSLSGFGERRTIAGRLPNTPANLVRWILDPQRIKRGDAMPDVGLSVGQARDVAAYLEGGQ
jgi:cytochrome c